MLVFALLLAALPPATSPGKPAASLVTNGAFATNLSGWKVSTGESNSDTGALAWSRLDAGGSKTSGSLESATADRNSFRVGQCIRIDPGVENLSFGGRIRVPPGQKARGIANLEIERFKTADCSDDAIPFDDLGGITNADFWSSRREIVAAADARSARLVASVIKFYEWRADDEIGETDDGNLRIDDDDVPQLRLADPGLDLGKVSDEQDGRAAGNGVLLRGGPEKNTSGYRPRAGGR